MESCRPSGRLPAPLQGLLAVARLKQSIEKYEESAENTEVMKPPGGFIEHLADGPITEVSGTVCASVKTTERF
jgi:hypothetical protein